MQHSKPKKAAAKTTSSALMIKPDSKKPVNRQQQTFNFLVNKVEKLRAELQNVSNTLDMKLKYYVENILPLETDILKCNIEITKILYWHFTKNKKLTKNQRLTLQEMISDKLNNILTTKSGEPDEELKEIFNAVEGITYEEAKKEEFEEMKEAMEAMFNGFGFDINMDEINSEMTEEELHKHAQKMHEQFKEQGEAKGQQETRRKKTKKQIAQEKKEELMEEARRKNISSIYKQLAKVLHPDLEQDEEIKLQKEELMKQLTSAYNKNDLHTLLSLELGWIHKEEKTAATLTKEKMAIYNVVLQEQVFELEMEIEMTYDHSRYFHLHKLVDYPMQIKKLKMKDVQKEKIEEWENLHYDFIRIKQRPPKDTAHIKKMIKDFNFANSLEEDDFDDFFPF